MNDKVIEGNLLVSVIIPLYNLENYIERSVNSVLSQTYKNIQIILVDDASTDASQDICKKLSNDERIVYIRHDKNKGQTVTRNDGLKAASGDWIMFLDGDDTIEPCTIENFLKVVIEDDNIDIVFAGYKIIKENTSIERLANIEPGIYSKSKFVDYLFDEVTSDILTCIGSKLYRNELVKERKDWTSDQITTNYDMAFVVDALLACKKVAYINEAVYDYIQRDNSITYSYRENMFCRINEARKKIPLLLKESECYTNKNIMFQKDQLRLVMTVLNQEVRFNKGYSQFRKRVDEVAESYQFKLIYDSFCKCQRDKKRFCYVLSVKKRMYFALYMLHKYLYKRQLREIN